MLLKTINRARRWRLSALAVLTLAAFIPPAIPATASASTVPHSLLFGQYTQPAGECIYQQCKGGSPDERTPRLQG